MDRICNNENRKNGVDVNRSFFAVLLIIGENCTARNMNNTASDYTLTGEL